MGETSEEIFISPDEIVKQENQPVVGLDQVDHYLQERGPLFYSVLGSLFMNDNNLGWQRMESTPEGSLNKKDTNGPDSNSTFTGLNLCDFASFAIYNALTLNSNFQDVDLDVVKLETDMHAEEWDRPGYQIKPEPHTIVKITDSKTGKVRFYDPTYRQIDHRVAGTIQAFSEDEIDTHYRGEQGGKIEMMSVLGNQRDAYIHRERVGVTWEKFQELQRVL